MGSWICILTIPGKRSKERGGRIFFVLLIVTGSIGSFRSRAITNAPFLNCASSSFSARVPSGSIIIEEPRSVFLRASFKDSYAALVSERSINMCPTFSPPYPNMGTDRNSFFSTHLKSIPSHPYSKKLSKWL